VTSYETPVVYSINTHNQIGGPGPFAYDAAGNLIQTGFGTYTYNAESELTSAGSVTYASDGDGNRVVKSSGKLYWYGPGGQVLDETDASGSMTDSSFNEYVYFDGERIARIDSSGNAFYYLVDHVGNSRAIAEVPTGTTTATLCYDADFYPFGGEIAYTNTCPQNYQFMGKERDPITESGFDDFGARYYASQFQRFVSADWSSIPAPIPYADLTNPQTLNLYAIVSDNPETFADLNGHDSGRTCYVYVAGGSNCPEAGPATNNAAEANTQTAQNDAATQQAQQQLSAKSQTAIDNAFGKGSANALLWGYSFLHAGAKNGVDPNLLVGLAAKESGLNPNAKNGTANGMFQITPGRASDLGLSGNALSNPNVVVNAVAGSLASAMKTFNGNTGLAIASWTVGVGGTRATFAAHGMQGVRNLLLNRAHPSYGRVGPNYIDFVTSFQSQ